MTREEIIRDYPIFDYEEFELTLRSIVALDSQDDLTDDRANLIDAFSRWSEENNDDFYYDMCEVVSFVLQNATAYTTPDGSIYLNYPNEEIIPQDNKRFERWYFVYCHECLHQLWDTFEVGNSIIKKHGSCDHELLNIASDCVINDFLSSINKKHKTPPIAGIYPDVLERDYGVKFNRRIDTQYSLYLKLNELIKKDKEKAEELKKKFGEKKIKPAKTKEIEMPGGGGGLSQKHDPDYVDGWTQAIEDVLNGKFDPLTVDIDKLLENIKK